VNETTREIALEVLRARREGEVVLVATLIKAPEDGSATTAGAKLLMREDGSRLGSLGEGVLEAAVLEETRRLLHSFPRAAVQVLYYDAAAQPITESVPRDAAFEVMVEVIEAPANLLIVGGGHIGLSLALMGAHVGFSVVVVDDRAMFANAERFPMADRILAGDIEASLRDFPISGSTYAVLVSRGHKVDELALRCVVGRGAAYVGMIGSKRRVSIVLRHLAEAGVPLAELERVHTPIGLDIGAETPEEIAVSILAEIIAVRRGGSGRPMRESRRRLQETDEE
jgi:xanthine dehydrogenase accessory factor